MVTSGGNKGGSDSSSSSSSITKKMMACLLCENSDVNQQGKNGLLGAFETRLALAEVPFPHGRVEDGATKKKGLNLWGTFVLTKLFNLEEEECQQMLLLFENGGDAGEDGVGEWISKRMCARCVQFVQRFRNRHEQLLEIEGEMGLMRKMALGRLPVSRVEGGRTKVEFGTGGGGQERARVYFRRVFGIMDNGAGNLSTPIIIPHADANRFEEQEQPKPNASSAPGGNSAKPLATTFPDAEDNEEQKKRKGDAITGSSKMRTHLIGHLGEEGTTCASGDELSISSTFERDADEELMSSDGSEATAVNRTTLQPRPQPEEKQARHYCTACPKSFQLKCNLTQHFLVHTGRKSFFCDFCKKGFSRKWHLKRHANTHTKERPPRVCLMCGNGFSRYSVLIQHTRVHTVEKPFFCKACGKEFSQYSSLTAHKMRAHSDR